jgi:hypothetical protein
MNLIKTLVIIAPTFKMLKITILVLTEHIQWDPVRNPGGGEEAKHFGSKSVLPQKVACNFWN